MSNTFEQDTRVIVFDGITEYHQKIKSFVDSKLDMPEKYRGVTKMLSSTKDQSGLDAWRLAVGEEEAQRIVDESIAIGKSLDKILLNHFLPDFNIDDYKDEPGLFLYKRLKPFLKKVDPIALQLKLWSNHLKTMGYLDCIGFYDGVISMIDFKNAKKEKTEEQLEDYFLQCTLYCIMLYELLGIKIDQIVLIIAVRNSSYPHIIRRSIKNYVKEAIARVRTYHYNKSITS